MATVNIDWGDGSADSNVTVPNPPADWSLNDQPHTYASAGTYTITVTGTGGGVDTVQVTVAAPPEVETVDASATVDGLNTLLDATGTYA